MINTLGEFRSKKTSLNCFASPNFDSDMMEDENALPFNIPSFF